MKQNFTADTLASLPLTRWSAFAGRQISISPTTYPCFGQALYTHYDRTTIGGPPVADNFWQVNIPRDGAHPVPTAFDALLDPRTQAGGDWVLGNLLSFMGMGTVEHANDVYQVTGGLRGDIPDTDLTWEVYGSYGRTQLTDKGASGFASLARYTELMRAPNYGANLPRVVRLRARAASVRSARSTAKAPASSATRPCHRVLGGPYRLSEHVPDQHDARSSRTSSRRRYRARRSRCLPEKRASPVGATYRDNGFAFKPDRQFAPDVNFAADIIGQFGILPVSGLEQREGRLPRAAHAAAEGPAADSGSRPERRVSLLRLQPCRWRERVQGRPVVADDRRAALPQAAISGPCVRRTSSSSSVRRRSCSMPRPMRASRTCGRPTETSRAIRTVLRCRRCAASSWARARRRSPIRQPIRMGSTPIWVAAPRA